MPLVIMHSIMHSPHSHLTTCYTSRHYALYYALSTQSHLTTCYASRHYALYYALSTQCHLTTCYASRHYALYCALSTQSQLTTCYASRHSNTGRVISAEGIENKYHIKCKEVCALSSVHTTRNSEEDIVLKICHTSIQL